MVNVVESPTIESLFCGIKVLYVVGIVFKRPTMVLISNH